MKKMKDSGIAWIGEIPENWETSKMKYDCEKITDFTASGSFASLAENVEYLDNPDYAMLIRTADLSRKRELSPIFINEHAYHYLSNSNLFGGEIILSNIGSVGEVFLYSPLYSKSSLAPNSIMAISKYDSRYLYYYLLSPTTNRELKELGDSSVQSKFNKTQIRNFKSIIPPVSEQKLIADFLDDKVGQMDAILDDLNKQVEILEKYKKALITETVTKGLHANVPMKDSGIDWIGTIPENWEIKKVRYLGNLQNGISKGAEFFGTGSPFVSYGDVYNNILLPEEVEGLVESTKSEQYLYSVKENDAFFTRTSETIEEIGFASVCRKTIEDSTFAGFLIRFRPSTNLLNMDYAKYYFRAEMLRTYFVKEMMIVTRASLGQDLLKNLPVLLPSLQEQKEIATYLDGKCAEIDETIADKKKQIEKMEKYKKSLIYEYVTGKRRVQEC